VRAYCEKSSKPFPVCLSAFFGKIFLKTINQLQPQWLCWHQFAEEVCAWCQQTRRLSIEKRNSNKWKDPV